MNLDFIKRGLLGWCACAAICFSFPTYGDLINFEALSQDFVLETKQIKIPGYPTAFNPSLLKWKGKILMTFRIRDPITQFTHQFGFVWLDKNFNLISEPKILDISRENPYHPRFSQDPRPMKCGGNLYVFYNNVIGPQDKEIRRMFLARLLIEDTIHVYHSTPIIHFDDAGRQPREKNWVPFSYQGNLYLADTLIPHRIQLVEHGTTFSTTVAKTKGNITWNWGQLRGGTQAWPVNGEYLAFFHSYKDMFSAHSPKKKISHYFMGAYTFKAKPPFNITRISPEPIVGKDFYHGPEYKTWKPLLVVFPGGFVHDKDSIWVSYGKQDHEIWIVKLDKRGLFDSLIPVETVEE